MNDKNLIEWELRLESALAGNLDTETTMVRYSQLETAPSRYGVLITDKHGTEIQITIA